MQRLTREYLMMASDELYDELVKHVQAVLEGPADPHDERFKELPIGLKMAWWVAAIDFEVPNGGFSQFFNNCEHPVETLQALRELGLSRRADLLERAMLHFERSFDRPRDFPGRWYGDMPREETPEEMALLTEYYEVTEGQEPPGPQIAAYARTHPEQFIGTT